MSGQALNFFEIKEASMIDRILSVSQKFKIKITIWLKDKEERYDTLCLDQSVKTRCLYLRTPLRHPDKPKFDTKEIIIGDLILGAMTIDNTNFFFKSNFVSELEGRLLKLEYPTSIFKLQRRTSFRVPFSRALAPRLTFINPNSGITPEMLDQRLKKESISEEALIKEKTILEYRVLDVSVGGIAFATKVVEKELFKLGQEIHDLKFKLKGDLVKATGVVKYIRESKSDRKQDILKIGIQFKKILAQHERIITQHVIEESRRMFSLLYQR